MTEKENKFAITYHRPHCADVNNFFVHHELDKIILHRIDQTVDLHVWHIMERKTSS